MSAEFKECFYCKKRFPGPFFTKHLKECKSRNKGNKTNSNSNSGTWKCNMCSYKNNSNAQSCLMCQQAKKPNNSLNSGKDWRCPSCTYVNTSTLVQCKICGSKKPNNNNNTNNIKRNNNNYGNIKRNNNNQSPNNNMIRGRGGPPIIRGNVGGRSGYRNNMMRGRGGPPYRGRGMPPNMMMRGRGGPPSNMFMGQRGRGMPPNMRGQRGRGMPPHMMMRGRGGPPPNMMMRGGRGIPPQYRNRGGPPNNMRGGRGMYNGPPPPNKSMGMGIGLPPPQDSDSDDDNNNNNNNNNNEEKNNAPKNNNNDDDAPKIDPQILKNMGIEIDNADPETMKLIIQMLEAELCGKCKKNQGFDLPCSHKLCAGCAKKYLLKGIVSQKWKKEPLICPINNCKSVMPEWIIKRSGLGANYQTQVDEMQRKYLMSTDKSMTQCPKCNEIFSAEMGDQNAINQKEKGLDGKLLTKEAQKHKLEHRFRCVKCTTIFCKTCKVMPYHLGYTCVSWKKYKDSKKCRFCEKSLTAKNIPDYNEDDDDLDDGLKGQVCKDEECQKKKAISCDRVLKCGHNCIGLRSVECLGCINPKCLPKNSDLTDEDYCNICWVDPLFAAPTIQLKCKHYFHFKCVWDKVDRKWPAARITFGFLNCPLCKSPIQDESLKDLTDPFYKLKAQIQKDATERLKIEGLAGDKRIKDPNSPYYNNMQKFAMDRLAFYRCFKCKKPYFGGMKACEEAGLEQEEKYVQEHLVCGSCASGPNTKSCKKHGKKYITYKCKFCCSISQWYCWGSTHFCDKCHKKQEKGDYLNRKPVSDLPKCPGKDKCPLGIEHPANGVAEFSLGCVVCLRK